MSLLKKILGFKPQEAQRPPQAPGQFRELFEKPQQNPFPAHRDRILRFDGELVSVAATGDHEILSRTLERFLAELNMYNSNVSRFIASPVKKQHPTGTSHHQRVQELYLDHNRYYIEIRRMCKALMEAAPLLAYADGGDDLAVLDQSQNEEVFGALRNIETTVEYLKAVWENLMPYENAIFKNG